MFDIYNFGTSTYTDELIRVIEANAPLQIDYVKKLYDAFSPHEMLTGVRYYVGDTDVLRREIHTYTNGNRVVDKEATNKRLASGFYKMLVDQKVSYLSGEPMSWASKTDNKQHLEIIENTIGKRWSSILPRLIKNSTNKGVEWLMPYVDEEGNFDIMTVGGEQVIPIYDAGKRFKMTAAIRFYSASEHQVKLELWTEKDVTYYEVIDNKIVIDITQEINPAPHFTNAEGTEGKSWGKVPFIKYANNDEEISDLKIIKPYIDEYEELTSDAQNTLSDMQSLIYVLKGYDGTSLSEFQENLKRYKAVKVDEDGGGIDTLAAEVPVQAYQAQVELLRKGIITFGQGVDPAPEVIGNSPSGVALKNLYNSLDQKASQQERIFEDANRELLYFLQVYCEEANIGPFDAQDITCSFNKLTITNEQEIINNLIQSVAGGIMSTSTAVTQHPYIQNGEEEMKKLEAQKNAELDAYGERYGSLTGDEDGEETDN